MADLNAAASTQVGENTGTPITTVSTFPPTLFVCVCVCVSFTHEGRRNEVRSEKVASIFVHGNCTNLYNPLRVFTTVLLLTFIVNLVPFLESHLAFLVSIFTNLGKYTSRIVGRVA